MFKSIFRLKKPRSGAFLLIPALPLVISGCFISSFKIKKQNTKRFQSNCARKQLRSYQTFD
ncbi:hypothetical protein CGH94_22695 [Vibrio parahaemolyticus]|nr:hypothetical protein CGH94_22695 [Vibrio parahaemolyticus]